MCVCVKVYDCVWDCVCAIVAQLSKGWMGEFTAPKVYVGIIK